MALLSDKYQHCVPVSGVRHFAHFANLCYSVYGQRHSQQHTKPQVTSRLPSQHATPLQSCTIPSSGAAHLEPALCHLLPLTCVFEDPLIGLHHRAEAVEHERPELGRRALRGLVVVEGSVGQDKPALLHLQGGHLVAALNLLMKPAWHGNTNMSLCASLAPTVRTNNFTVILDLLQNKEKKD